jgi:hypothetical protein
MKYFLLLTFLLSLSSIARAEVYVWQDPKYDITLTFPHDWMRQAKEGDDLRLHILAPQGADHAACRVFANNDNRFLYVPPVGATEVTQTVQDEQALKGILANRLAYTDVNLIGYQNVGSLGKGPATVAIGQFQKDWNGNKIAMQSIVFGGYVQGLETIFQCESTSDGWARWHPLFMSMAESFDFPVRTAALKNGYYLDFMADGFVYFPVGNQQGIARY